MVGVIYDHDFNDLKVGAYRMVGSHVQYHDAKFSAIKCTL